jgi:hypothetical protein
MRFILCFLLLAFSTSTFSQKVLKLDTPRNPSKAAYYIGTTIVFKLENNKQNTVWYQERIVDFDTEKGYILFENWKVHYKDIITVKNPNARLRLRTTGSMVKTFGLGLIFFSTVGRLSKDCPNCNEALGVGAATLLTGWLVERFSGVKKWDIGKRNRLHLLDLTPKPTKEPDKV